MHLDIGDPLDSPCRNLYKWVYEGSHVLVFDIVRRPLDLARSCKDQRPKINSMNKLPIINLLVRLLHIDKPCKTIKKGQDLRNVTNLSFQLHAITKMDGQLSNKAERMLIRSLVIEGENLRC
jgi:hypothetical protein